MVEEVDIILGVGVDIAARVPFESHQATANVQKIDPTLSTSPKNQNILEKKFIISDRDKMKQIDIKTMKTIVLGSLKCPTSREADLLNQMPKLARKLAQSPKHQILMRQLTGD